MENQNTQGQLPLNGAKKKFSLRLPKMSMKTKLTGLLLFMGLWLVGACLYTVMAGGNNKLIEIDRKVSTLRGEIIELETDILTKKEAYAQAMLQKVEAEKKVALAHNAMILEAQKADEVRATILEKEHAIDALIEEKAMLQLGFSKPQ